MTKWLRRAEWLAWRCSMVCCDVAEFFRGARLKREDRDDERQRLN